MFSKKKKNGGSGKEGEEESFRTKWTEETEIDRIQPLLQHPPTNSASPFFHLPLFLSPPLDFRADSPISRRFRSIGMRFDWSFKLHFIRIGPPLSQLCVSNCVSKCDGFSQAVWEFIEFEEGGKIIEIRRCIVYGSSIERHLFFVPCKLKKRNRMKEWILQRLKIRSFLLERKGKEDTIASERRWNGHARLLARIPECRRDERVPGPFHHFDHVAA